MKIIVKQFGKIVEELTSWSDNEPVMRDCRNHEVKIDTWAAAMNYIETDGNRTAGSGDYYYDTVEDAAKSLIDGGVYETAEEVVEFYNNNRYLIGELSDGELVFEDEDDDE